MNAAQKRAPETKDDAQVVAQGIVHELFRDEKFITDQMALEIEINSVESSPLERVSDAKALINRIVFLREARDKFHLTVDAMKLPFRMALDMLQDRTIELRNDAEDLIRNRTRDIAKLMDGEKLSSGMATLVKDTRVEVEVEDMIELARSVADGRLPVSVLRADTAKLRALALAEIPLYGVKVTKVNGHVVRRVKAAVIDGATKTKLE